MDITFEQLICGLPEFSRLVDITMDELNYGTKRLLPKWKDIPKEFRNKTKWHILYRIWMESGIARYELKPKLGILFKDVVKILAAHMSYRGKGVSETHKRCGIAYMMSMFLDNYKFIVKDTDDAKYAGS